MQGRYQLADAHDAQCEVKPWTKVPVLVIPDSLQFSSHPNSHKQILSIYNTSSSPVAFQVFATFPDAYTVHPATGVISAQSQQDVIVRVKLAGDGLQRDTHEQDKFLIETIDKLNLRRGKRMVSVCHLSPSQDDEGDHLQHDSTGLPRAVLPLRNKSTLMLRLARGNQPIAVLLRLLPLLLGTLTIVYLTKIYTPATNSRCLASAFFVGLLTMHAQLKFLED